MSHIEVALNSSRIDASRNLFLVLSSSFAVEQRRTADQESRTVLIVWSSVLSYNKCLTHATLSTASASASSAAVLVLQATRLAKRDIHAIE